MSKLLSEIIKPEGKDGGIKSFYLDDVPNPKYGDNPPKDAKHWGYHLIVDCSDCNHDVDNPKKVSEFLEEMVVAIKMKAIGKPIVHQFKGPFPERGTSATQIISTSSITFHSDDEIWGAYIDVFSCKKFKPEVAIKVIKKYFQPKSIVTLWLYRDASKKWPVSKNSKFK